MKAVQVIFFAVICAASPRVRAQSTVDSMAYVLAADVTIEEYSAGTPIGSLHAGNAVYLGNGYFVTAFHVVEDAGSFALISRGGFLVEIGTTIVYAEALDIAIVRVHQGPLTERLTPITLAERTVEDQDIRVAGFFFPRDLGSLDLLVRACEVDQVVDIDRNIDGQHMEGPMTRVVCDEITIPGMSGGPAVSRGGLLVGFLSWINFNGDGYEASWLVPVEIIRWLLNYAGIELPE